MCDNIRQKAYPVVEKNGILFAYMGPGEPPPFPHFDCFVAPASHTFAFKGFIDCNWLQSLEVGIDPAHTSFLHRFFNDDKSGDTYGRLFRDKSADSDMPITQIVREHTRPQIDVEPTDYGMRILTTRRLSDAVDPHPRHQSRVPARVPHPAQPRDDDHAVARADRRHDALLVRDLHQLRRPGRQGRDAAPAARALRAARLRPAQEQEQRLRLRSARAGARDLHRHGRRHQRARPVGVRVDGRDPGPHQRASRPVRQGDQRLPAHPAPRASTRPATAASR